MQNCTVISRVDSACIYFMSAILRRSAFTQFRKPYFSTLSAMSVKVTSKNFENLLPAVKAAIAAADIIAFDTELTGLRVHPQLREQPFDSIDSRWMKLRHSAEHIAVLQYGICMFEYDSEKGCYRARPFSFYLQPQTAKTADELHGFAWSKDAAFVVQTDALKFLSRHGFDFNVMAAEGISTLSQEEESDWLAVELRRITSKFESIERTFHERLPAYNIIVPSSTDSVSFQKRAPDDRTVTIMQAQDSEWFSAVQKDVMAWVVECTAKPTPPSKSAASDPIIGVEQYEDISFPKFCVDSASPFRRLLLHALASQDGLQGNVVVLSDERDGKDGDDRKLKPMRIIWVGPGKEGIHNLCFMECKRQLLKLHELSVIKSGFRQVLELIAHSKKPFVGHNCALDVLHTSAKFMGKLPVALSNFATTWTAAFPLLFDTKYLIATPVRGDRATDILTSTFAGKTSLQQAYGLVCDTLAVKRATKGLSTTPVPAFDPLSACPIVLATDLPGSADTAARVDAQPEEQPFDPEDAAHDAGADAFMTGSVFLRVCGLLSRELEGESGCYQIHDSFMKLAASTEGTNGSSLPGALLGCVNRLHLMQVSNCVHSVLNLADAAAANSLTTAFNSVVASRKQSSKVNLVWLRIPFGLLGPGSDGVVDELRALVAATLDIRPQLIDKYVGCRWVISVNVLDSIRYADAKTFLLWMSTPCSYLYRPRFMRICWLKLYALRRPLSRLMKLWKLRCMRSPIRGLAAY
jgi:hypothetical protein